MEIFIPLWVKKVLFEKIVSKHMLNYVERLKPIKSNQKILFVKF